MEKFNICSNFPPILYKYFPPERQDFFLEPRLRFTPPHEFNDPFESMPSVFTDGIPISDESYGNNYTTIGNLLPSLGIGILCLSDNPLNLLMHAHYAHDHRGFVIGFKVASLLHLFNRLNMDLTFDKVIYTDSRKRFELNEIVDRTVKHENFLYKSPCWEYESEWRMIIKYIYRYEKIVESSNGPKKIMGLIDIEKESIREIYLCARPHPNLLYKAPNFLDENPFSKLFLCRLSRNEYSFELKEIQRHRR